MYYDLAYKEINSRGSSCTSGTMGVPDRHSIHDIDLEIEMSEPFSMQIFYTELPAHRRAWIDIGLSAVKSLQGIL